MINIEIKNNIESLRGFLKLSQADLDKICLLNGCLEDIFTELADKYYKEYWINRSGHYFDKIDSKTVKYIFASWLGITFACVKTPDEKHDAIFWAIGNLENENKLAPIIIHHGIEFLRHEAQALVICDDENLPLALKLELIISIFKVLDLSELILNECL